jgi:glycine/D-amino acid oxidase-like deaminating enzyme
MAGLSIPVEPRRRSLFVFDCRQSLPGRIPLTIDPSGVFFRPEGRFYLTGTTPQEDRVVDVDDFVVMHSEFDEQIWPVLAARVPAFEAIKVVNAWAGHYDYCLLDHNAIVGPHPAVGNFFFANGFTGHGLQQAPAVGRGISELIASGVYRTLDLSPLSYQRVAANRPFLESAVI